MLSNLNKFEQIFRYATQADIAKLETNLRAEIASVRTEVASVKNDLSKQIADSQRWTITAMFAGLGALAILQKFL